jgi:hypothetical protein
MDPPDPDAEHWSRHFFNLIRRYICNERLFSTNTFMNLDHTNDFDHIFSFSIKRYYEDLDQELDPDLNDWIRMDYTGSRSTNLNNF